MKTDSYLDKIHGQHARILERKFALGLISKYPDSMGLKRIYGSFIFIPLKITSAVLCEVLHLIEAVASCAIHLVGALFSHDKNRELENAKRSIRIGLPCAVIECALRIILMPAYFIQTELMNVKAPEKIEQEVRSYFSFDEGIKRLEEWLEVATEEKTKKQIQRLMDSLKNEVPISQVESFFTFIKVKKEQMAL